MHRRIRTLALVTAAAFTAIGTMAFDDYTPEETGYTYVWYYDAAKTQEGGVVTDYGCGGWGQNHWVQRAYVPSGYYDTYTAFYCGPYGMEPI